MSTTSRAFCADPRKYFALAIASISEPQCLPGGLGRLLRLGARVPLEGARRGELAELVADHVLRHVDGDVALAVVDGEGQADEVGRDGRAARPRLDGRRTGVPAANLFDLLLQMPVNERAFFYRTGHNVSRFALLTENYFERRSRTIIFEVRFVLR